MRIFRFGTVNLPAETKPNDEHSMPIQARSSLIQLGNGALDQDGQRLVLETSKLSWRALIVSNIDSTLNTLLKEVGKGRNIIQAKLRDNVTILVTYAKMVSVQRAANVNTYTAEEPIAITFEQDFPFWINKADGWYFDTGEFFDSGLVFDGLFDDRTITASPHSWTITNDGTARGILGTITIVPNAASSLTNPLISNAANGFTMQWTGTLNAGDRLVIDFLTKTVELNGSPSYANFSLSGPKQVEYFALELGDNVITVTGVVVGTVHLFFQRKRLYL